MILVIDTSAEVAAVAVFDPRSGGGSEQLLPARSAELRAVLRSVAQGNPITKVAVVNGPGSFTGLRVGVAFGLGLAMGLRIPIVALPTLELQAARSDQPVTAIVAAGRGRFYFLLPKGTPRLGEPADIPTTHPLVGRLGNRAASLVAAGHFVKPERELRSFTEAASKMLETAPEVAYGRLKIDYMQSFSAPKS